MWFPPELWREIKNYALGTEYWKRRFTHVLSTLPKTVCIIPAILSSATQKIRFCKSFERNLWYGGRIGKRNHLTPVYQIF